MPNGHIYDPGDGGFLALRIINRDGTPVSAGGGGGTSSVDDAAFTVAASSGTPVGGIATSDLVDAGDFGAFAMLTNRQQKVSLYDSSGAEITSFGGGTEYTEDAASAADPKGGMLMLRRRDVLSATEVSTESDNIAANATNKGELYVKHSDAIAVTGPLTDTQLRASAVPVSLASAPTTAVTLAAGASAIAKAEDVGSADGDVGVPAMARRTATPANTSSNDLDYEMLQMANGRLWASATIDAALPAGTNAIGKLAANAGVTIGAVEIAAAQTLGTVTTVSTVTSLTQMNGAAIAMNTGVRAAGVQRVTIATDDIVPASQSGTWTVQPGNTANTTAWKVDASSVAVPITDNAGSLTVDAPVGTPAFVRLSDGAAAITTLAVSLASVPSHAVTNAGTFAVQAADAGDVAHDGVDSGNPVKMGAQARSSEPSAVSTNADRVNLIADLVGKLIVLPYANPENFVSGAITSAMSGTTTTSLIAAPSAGLRNYITQITVSNGSTTVPTDILIQDGSGGTTLYVLPAPIGTGTGTGTSGGTYVFPTPLRQPTTATALFCANVTTGSSTKVSASGYKGA